MGLGWPSGGAWLCLGPSLRAAAWGLEAVEAAEEAVEAAAEEEAAEAAAEVTTQVAPQVVTQMAQLLATDARLLCAAETAAETAAASETASGEGAPTWLGALLQPLGLHAHLPRATAEVAELGATELADLDGFEEELADALRLTAAEREVLVGAIRDQLGSAAELG